MNKLRHELIRWLNQQQITPENIGWVRRQCFMPWESEWNSLVREETAQREQGTREQKRNKTTALRRTI